MASPDKMAASALLAIDGFDGEGTRLVKDQQSAAGFFHKVFVLPVRVCERGHQVQAISQGVSRIGGRHLQENGNLSFQPCLALHFPIERYETMGLL